MKSVTFCLSFCILGQHVNYKASTRAKQLHSPSTMTTAPEPLSRTSTTRARTSRVPEVEGVFRISRYCSPCNNCEDRTSWSACQILKLTCIGPTLARFSSLFGIAFLVISLDINATRPGLIQKEGSTLKSSWDSYKKWRSVMGVPTEIQNKN